ncbi:toll/interleukin-1 receptor domain-containing protein [Morganella morganii]|uniref:toll/interleukin-1 receptor domain-containing protein n=1 Tax=Morganella morganii TaxID=582 RepID=UPI002367C2B4|nr:toll/interleukin-1 receptor domain-containing protein [Morganella morganii]
MIKAFLSHSSADKEQYVRKVANLLGRHDIIYDEFTFEKGEKTLDEISIGLKNSALFVLFISDASLNSDWVKKEITESKQLLDSEKLKILPIIIDDTISYKDKRIPSWLKENYNLQPIHKIKRIVNRIKNKIYAISWERHPKIEKINSLFIGRNNYIEEFEERISDYDRDRPVAIITSGIPGVGRRTFMYNALKKTKLSSGFVNKNSIVLDRNDSIEDFILKLNDIGVIDNNSDILSLSSKSISEKEKIIKVAFSYMYDNDESLFIFDDGCVVDYQRKITDWLIRVIDSCDSFKFPILFIASSYKVNFQNQPKGDKFYFFEINELNQKERKRLLSSFLEIEEMAPLSSSSFNDVCNLLTGLPEQVRFAVSLIKDKKIFPFENKLPLLAEYNSDKAKILIKKYDGNEKALDFIRLLAQLEVITLDFLFSITGKDTYIEILEDLVSENICELIGQDNLMVRLNDIIRDYIKRNRLDVNNDFSLKIRDLVKGIVSDKDLVEENSSVYMFSIKEMLKSNEKIDTKYIIPSHYLRCMKDLYNTQGSLDRVIELADIILQKEGNMEDRISQNIRYYLCLALAKKADNRLLKEVQKINGNEHKFLIGFYYRKCGRPDDALRVLKEIINEPYVDARAKREIVQAYTQLEEYDEALTYAKNNYIENKNNQFHCQAYFNCLINSKNQSDEQKETLLELIKTLDSINSEQSKEMSLRAKAMFESKINNNENTALDYINDAIDIYGNSPYPLLVKCDICLAFKNKELLKSTIESLESISKKRPLSERTMLKYKAGLLVLNNKHSDASELIYNSRIPREQKEKLIKNIIE